MSARRSPSIFISAFAKAGIATLLLLVMASYADGPAKVLSTDPFVLPVDSPEVELVWPITDPVALAQALRPVHDRYLPLLKNATLA